ncbi:hypothetical protein [uncultured Sphingomonas sp.]|uniref:hypothetical protein n=1 Tax=uncultured Sphingomonas sp. TaxID=158754 RepID=UPI00374A77CF
MIPPHLRRRNPPPPTRPGYWFLPKAYGYGAYPATVMGWAVLFGYMLALGVTVQALPTDGARIILGTALTIGLVIVVAVKTDGGLRWRWGGK